MGCGLYKGIYSTFTRRSYNYLLHNLTPDKLKTLSFLSSIPAPGIFLIIFSRAVFCQSAVSLYVFFSHSLVCTVLVLYRLVDEYSLSWDLPSREHLVEPFIFLAVMQTTLSSLREQKIMQPLTCNGRVFLTLGRRFYRGLLSN
jgi:membrane-associated PAP2 superfamily phosphatase